MSNLRFNDTDLDNMESQPTAQAMQIGRTVPYHLAYAQVYRDNDILNPRLPGKRMAEAGEEENA